LTYLFPAYVNGLYLCRDTANERDILIDVNTLANQMFAQSPHVTPAKVLVLENEFHIVRRIVGWIHFRDNDFVIIF
jgi:hypothetical protein